MWVLLVPWLATLDRTRSWRGALASGVGAALAFSIAVFAWFPPAIADYTGAPLWAAALVGLLFAPLFQPQFVAFALVWSSARRCGAGTSTSSIAGACAWVATEWAVPKLFGDTLGIGLFPSLVLRQAADVLGVAGLTLVVVLANEWIYAACRAMARGERRRVAAPLAALGCAVGGLALYGRLRLAQLPAAPTDPPIEVGVVQADVAHYDRLAAEVGTYEAVREILDAHFALSEKLLAEAPVDVLVWPETVYPTTFGAPKSADGAAFDREIAGLALRAGKPLVFGSYDAEDGHEYNAAVFLQPGSGGEASFGTYRKASLFPLTERVPAWLDGPTLRAWLPWAGSWQPGDGSSVVDLRLADRLVRVAPLICYDAVDPENAARAVRAGAELILTLSNDSWLAEGDGARLHFIVSAFRSIETRRPQVRATTTGISAVIAPTGEVEAEAGVHERTVLAARVAPIARALPLAVRFGRWLGPAATAIAAIALVASFRPARRSG